MKTANLTNLTKYPDKVKLCQVYPLTNLTKQNHFVRHFVSGTRVAYTTLFPYILTILTKKSLVAKIRELEGLEKYIYSLKLPKSPNTEYL